MPPALLLAGSGPAGAPLPIVKIANVGKTLNDVAFCGDWLALALSGAVKVRALHVLVLAAAVCMCTPMARWANISVQLSAPFALMHHTAGRHICQPPG